MELAEMQIEADRDKRAMADAYALHKSMQSIWGDPAFQARLADGMRNIANDPAYQRRVAESQMMAVREMYPPEYMTLRSIQRRFDRCCHGR